MNRNVNNNQINRNNIQNNNVNKQLPDVFKELRKKEPAAYKFINETNHIENDYVFQLDPLKFYSVPDYYLQKLNAAVNGL